MCIRRSVNGLLGGLIILWGTVAVAAGQSTTPNSLDLVSLESQVTFFSEGGDPIVVPAGHYVLSGGEAQIVLTELSGQRILVAAEVSNHSEPLEREQGQLLFGASGYVHLIVLHPDGRTFEAVGSPSGVFTRQTYALYTGCTSRPTGSAPVPAGPSDPYPYSTGPSKPHTGPCSSNTAGSSSSNTAGRTRPTTTQTPKTKVGDQRLSYWGRLAFLPDLAVSSCSHEAKGDAHSFVSVIKNQGKKPAVFQSGQLIATASGAVATTVSAPGGGLYLPVGATYEVRAGVGMLEPGTHTVTWSVDSNDLVAEAAEFNNTRSCSATVYAFPSTPQINVDYIISSVQVQPESGDPSTSFTISRTVTNLGTEAYGIGQFPWCFVDGRSLGGTDERGKSLPIPPSGSKTFIFRNVTGLVPGTRTLRCKVDYRDDVIELREDNNTMSRRISISK